LSLEAAEKLRPRLSSVELTLWLDCANGLLAKNINLDIAKAAADAAVKEADLETESVDKWDVEDD
jgi:hypothetical protein